VYAVETPATSQLIEASVAQPYMAVAFSIDTELIAGLLIDHGPAFDGDSFVTSHVDDELLDAWRRMLRLLDRPADIPVLAPLLEREIAFRLLQG
ncbi:AraC family transcriptional regulator, partial [bacterium M00.F.Ca.ET.141.01.1.1]